MKYKVEVKNAVANLFEVKMRLTPGELIALREMLHQHQTAVQSDICAMFDNALIRAEITL